MTRARAAGISDFKSRLRISGTLRRREGGERGMKKIGNGRALLFLLVLAAGLTGWIFRADRAQETLFDGRTFSAEEQVCLLRDIREVSQGHYRFCFYVVEDCGPLTLSLIHLPSFFLSVNGERVYEYREEEGYRRIVRSGS